MPSYNPEADEIDIQDLEAASGLYDRILNEVAERELRTLSSPALEILIENWMMALGGLTGKDAIAYCAKRIREAQAILDDRRKANVA